MFVAHPAPVVDHRASEKLQVLGRIICSAREDLVFVGRIAVWHALLAARWLRVCLRRLLLRRLKFNKIGLHIDKALCSRLFCVVR